MCEKSSKALDAPSTASCALRDSVLDDWKPSTGYLTPGKVGKIAREMVAKGIVRLSEKEITQLENYFYRGCPKLKGEEHE